LIWLVANVYPTFTYADYPQRWAADAAEQLWRTASAIVNRCICGWSSSWRRAVCAGGGDNPAGLLYRGDVLGAAAGVV
jgi:hypothetical protein